MIARAVRQCPVSSPPTRIVITNTEWLVTHEFVLQISNISSLPFLLLCYFFFLSLLLQFLFLFS